MLVVEPTLDVASRRLLLCEMKSRPGWRRALSAATPGARAE